MKAKQVQVQPALEQLRRGRHTQQGWHAPAGPLGGGSSQRCAAHLVPPACSRSLWPHRQRLSDRMGTHSRPPQSLQAHAQPSTTRRGGAAGTAAATAAAAAAAAGAAAAGAAGAGVCVLAMVWC